MQYIIQTAEQGAFGPFDDPRRAAEWAINNAKGDWTLVKLRRQWGHAVVDGLSEERSR